MALVRYHSHDIVTGEHVTVTRRYRWRWVAGLCACLFNITPQVFTSNWAEVLP